MEVKAIVWAAVGLLCIASFVLFLVMTAWFVVDPIMSMNGHNESSWYFITFEWWFYLVWVSSLLPPMLMLPFFAFSPFRGRIHSLIKFFNERKLVSLALCTLVIVVFSLATVALVLIIAFELFIPKFPTRFTSFAGIYIFTPLSLMGAILFSAAAMRFLRSLPSEDADSEEDETPAQAPETADFPAKGIDTSQADFAMADFAPAFQVDERFVGVDYGPAKEDEKTVHKLQETTSKASAVQEPGENVLITYGIESAYNPYDIRNPNSFDAVSKDQDSHETLS